MNITINYLAVLIASIGALGLGFLWYSPLLFGIAWMKEKGLTQEKLNKAKEGMQKLYALTFVASLVTAYVLSHVMALSQNVYRYPNLVTGFSSGFWMWLGFIMPVQLTAAIFGDKNWKLLAIDTGYQLASIVTMGVILGIL